MKEQGRQEGNRCNSSVTQLWIRNSLCVCHTLVFMRSGTRTKWSITHWQTMTALLWWIYVHTKHLKEHKRLCLSPSGPGVANGEDRDNSLLANLMFGRKGRCSLALLLFTRMAFHTLDGSAAPAVAQATSASTSSSCFAVFSLLSAYAPRPNLTC